MEITVSTVNDVTVIAFSGELDAASAPAAQQRVMPLVGSGAKLLLDMAGVEFMSSAGIRLLLSTYRQAVAGGGRIIMVGLSDELRDTMAMTGFLDFFSTSATVDTGLSALAD